MIAIGKKKTHLDHDTERAEREPREQNRFRFVAIIDDARREHAGAHHTPVVVFAPPLCASAHAYTDSIKTLAKSETNAAAVRTHATRMEWHVVVETRAVQYQR